MQLTNLEEQLTKEPGNYILILEAKANKEVSVGSAGKLIVELGYYFYVGSARGPGGVLARVRRHYQQTKKFHWHIDYLRAETELVEVWYTYSTNCYEHMWANYFLDRGGEMPLSGFGASDCDCPSHLFFFSTLPSLTEFKKWFAESEDRIYSL